MKSAQTIELPGSNPKLLQDPKEDRRPDLAGVREQGWSHRVHRGVSIARGSRSVEIGGVLHHVEGAVRRFDTAPGPLTQQVIAADLLDAYQFLRERERKAPLGPRRELLKNVRSSGGPNVLVPWTPALPTRLEDVTAEGAARPLFGRDSVDRWLSAVSYRVPPAPQSKPGRRVPPPQRPSEPVDSTVVHPFNVTLVRGNGQQRLTLPWPLPRLVTPNSYRIELVKGAGMTFLTRAGRIKILAYLLEVVAENSPEGDVYSSDKGQFVDPEELAAFMTETASVGYGNLLFEGPESEFKVFERAQVGEARDFVITDEMLQIFRLYTDIKPKFRWKDKAEAARGCGSIEWLTELLKDVPFRYKEFWIQDRMINDRAVYPNNLKVGDVVPAKFFLTEKLAEALGNQEHYVTFIGSFTANDRIIKTEDGRVWLVKEHERNLQAYCQAIIDLQGMLTLSFILVSAIGAVLGGPLVSFLMVAGDVAIDINEAGGIRNFLKDLKDHPHKAGLFMLDLAFMCADIKGMRALLMNPKQTIEASIRAAEAGAKAGKALPAGAATADRAASTEARLADGAGVAQAEGHLAEANRGAEKRALDQAPAGDRGIQAKGMAADPASGRPTAESRGAPRPADPPPPPPPAPPRAKVPPDIEVVASDAAREHEAVKAGEKVAEDAEEAASAGRRRRPRPRDKAIGREGTKRNVRERRPKGGGERRRGQLTPGSQPLRGNARRGVGAIMSKDPLKALVAGSKPSLEAVEKLERLKCGSLARDIAEEFAEHAEEGRKVLARVAGLAEEEIQGLAAVQKALLKEPVELGATDMLHWLDVLNVPPGARRDLLQLVGRIEPLVDSGLSRALKRALETGEYSLQGGLGHLHAAAQLADEYRGVGIRMIFEEPAQVAGAGFREIDIRATIGGALELDVEVKTYLGSIVISRSVQGQIVKDLLRRMDGGWEGLRYLYSPNVREELGVVKRAITDAFHSPAVRKALAAKKIDEAAAFDTLLQRLDDTVHPMVDVYVYSPLK